VAVLIDGVPVLDTVTGQFAHYDMSIQGFKRVEVQRGPGSALYGGNVQTAVINLVSIDDERGAEVRTMAGTATDLRGHGRVQIPMGAAGKLALFAQVQRTDGISQRVGPDGTAQRSDLSESQAAQSLTDPAHPNFISRRQEPATYAQGAIAYYAPLGFYARSRLMFRSIAPLVNPSVGGGKTASAITEEGSFQRQDLTVATELGVRRPLTTWLDLAVSLRHVFNRRAQDGRLTGPLFLNKDRDFDLVADAWPQGQYERYAYHDHVFSADAQLDFKLPLNALIAGATASYSLLSDLSYEANFAPGRSTSAGVAPTASDAPIDLTGQQFLLPNLQRRTLALFVQDVFTPRKWLDVIAGVRLDLISDVGIVSGTQVRAAAPSTPILS
jgi:outer membrane receptor protein involved in Fe transport